MQFAAAFENPLMWLLAAVGNPFWIIKTPSKSFSTNSLRTIPALSKIRKNLFYFIKVQRKSLLLSRKTRQNNLNMNITRGHIKSKALKNCSGKNNAISQETASFQNPIK
jgi:hypothetical protein